MVKKGRGQDIWRGLLAFAGAFDLAIASWLLIAIPEHIAELEVVLLALGVLSVASAYFGFRQEAGKTMIVAAVLSFFNLMVLILAAVAAYVGLTWTPWG